MTRMESRRYNSCIEPYEVKAMETLIGRAHAARKPAAKSVDKKPVARPAQKRKPDSRTRQFLDAVLGLKL